MRMIFWKKDTESQLKKRIYDLKCSLHGGIIPVSVPPEVPLREFPYNAVVELVNPVADTVSRKTYAGCRCGLVCKGRGYCVEE